MSTDEKLTFQCPACQSTLKVPVQLAGVQGPCPQCGTDIIAPNPAFRSAARVVAAPQLAGVASGGSAGADTYGQPAYPQAPAPAVAPAAYNPWQPDASPGQDAGSPGELNLGATLAAPPVAAVVQHPATPAQYPASLWTLAPPSPPAIAPAPRIPEQAPAQVDPASAFAMPGFGGGSAAPIAPTAAVAGFPESPPAPAPGDGGGAFAGPSLFPTSPAAAPAAPARQKEDRGPRIKKRRREGEARKAGKPSPVLLVAGGLALAAGGAFFFVPGLKDRILGKTKALDVSVETAIPVPRKPVVAAGTATDPVASASGEGTSTAEPASMTVPALLPIDPEAASRPAPDFGLGDSPAVAPAESPLSTPVAPTEAVEAPVAPPTEAAVRSNTAGFRGDATSSPEDVASARTILENFIRAATIEERLSYSQPAPGIEEQMRAYYAKHPAPITPVQINYTLANILEGSTKRFFIFEVTTDRQQLGFPVAVEETEDGMKVDWRSFIEFHDNMLGRFINVYQQQPESFRVILERAHYFKTDVPDLGGKLAFRIKPPIPGFEGFAFCPKDSPIGEELDRKFSWDVKYLPIVELEWVKDDKGAKYIRIVRVIQDNWRALQ